MFVTALSLLDGGRTNEGGVGWVEARGQSMRERFFFPPFFCWANGVCLSCTSTDVCLVVLTFDESYWQRFFVGRTRLVR